jgi:hypothetical protein
MMMGAWTAAKQERIKFNKIKGYGSKGIQMKNNEFINIQKNKIQKNNIINFQLPPNEEILSETFSPKVVSFSYS